MSSKSSHKKCRCFPALISLKTKSELHQEAWGIFEQILEQRAQLAMLSQIILSTIAILLRSDGASIAEADFEKEDTPYVELGKEYLDYAKNAQIVINLTRVIIFGASFWYKRLTRTFLPFETLTQAIILIAPTN